jgi:hypothetical protein
MQPFAFYVRRSFDCRIREEATDVTAPVRNRFYVNLDEVRTERLTLIDPLRSYATCSGMSAFKPISDNCELPLIFGLFVVEILTSR